MNWGKLYADLPRSMSLRRAGRDATLLFVFGLCHCIEQERDVIEDEALPLFGIPKVDVAALALCREGRWVRIPGGYRVLNFFPMQAEAFELAQHRRAEANRKREERVRKKMADTSRDASADAVPDSPRNVRHQSREELNNPPTPRGAGGHDGSHDNCRACGTNRRGPQKAPNVPPRYQPGNECEHGAPQGSPCIDCRRAGQHVQ